jgi:pyridoxamine 5'-phosphate oxidase
MERQVRIEGKVEVVRRRSPMPTSHRVQLENRIAAWSSDQSRAVEDRSQLEERYERWKERFADGDVPRPLHWGGYRVGPTHGVLARAPNRLHDRIAFEHFADGSWGRVRLQP